MALKFIFADDNPIDRLGIVEELKKLGYGDIVEIADKKEIITQLDDIHPELLILGNGFSEASSLDYVKKLHCDFPDVKIVIFSAYCHELIVIGFLQLGINGYVLKQDDLSCIGLAIQTVIKNGIWISPKISDKIIQRLLKNESQNCLTPRELHILRLLSSGKRDKDMASMLNVSERTIRYCLKKIFRKVDVCTRLEAVKWATSNGIS